MPEAYEICGDENPDEAGMVCIQKGAHRSHMARGETGLVHWDNKAFVEPTFASGKQSKAKLTDIANRLADGKRNAAGVARLATEAIGVDPTVNAPGMIRSDATPTSAAAGFAVAPRTGTKRYQVLMCLANSDGLTDEEVQDRLFLSHQSQTPRRLELKQGGWIEESGQVRLTRSGQESIVWVLTPKGAEWVARNREG